MAHILVTGGAGFIGANLVDRLIGHGHTVRVVDNLSTGLMDRLGAGGRPNGIEFIHGDIRDSRTMAEAAHGVDRIYHLAATVGVSLVLSDPAECIANIVDGTRSVLAAARQVGARVVFASSSEVYGLGGTQPLAEDDERRFGSTTTARWAYGEAKAIGEYLCQQEISQGHPISIVRYFNAYGPGLNRNGHHSVTAALIHDCLNGAPMRIYGDGTQRRCFTYVDDIVAGTIATMETQAALGQTLNIGATTATSIATLAEHIGEECGWGNAAAVTHVPFKDVYGDRFAESHDRSPNMDRARRVIGFEAETGLRDGIARTVAWWRKGSAIAVSYARVEAI